MKWRVFFSNDGAVWNVGVGRFYVSSPGLVDLQIMP